jgi:hypothetical protein
MLLVVSWGLTLAAQTQIDLRTQARNIDFSAATSTRPMKTGTALPATCAVGNMFFKTDAPAGANLYGCSTANTWMVQGGIPMGNCQYNANSQILTCTDSSNDVYTTVETATSGTAGQWVDYIAPTGIPHTSQPAFAQISGTASASQLPGVAMLTNQGNAVTAGTQDFSNAAHTLPMKAGTTAMRPALCAVGEEYFATDAPAGSNVYACAAANVWTAQGNLSVKSAGFSVGTRGAANFITGAGLIGTVSDDGSEINIQSALDTAVVETQPGEQSGSALLCASSSGSGSRYTCALSPTLAAYTLGMVLHWKPDVAGAGGPTTLNVDTLGAAPVMQADGVTNPASSTIVAGQLYPIWYDGNVFRFGNAGTSASITYPGAGVVSSTGSAWGPSYALGSAANNLVQLNASGQLPAVSAALLTNFPTFNQNTTGTASNVTGTVAVANGGTGVVSLPGVSGSYLYNNGGALGAKAIVASDLPTALSASASVNGTAIPPNTTLMTTSTMLAASQMWGSGTKPVSASALGTSGNCVQWSAAGIGDTGSPCGSGSGSGANALGYYFVSQSANEPANAVNLGALNTGLLKISVSGGVAAPLNATPGADYVTPGGSITGTAANVTGTVAIVNGGTGVTSPLTGLVRGASTAMTAAELSGDATTNGSNVVTVAQVHGTSVPLNSAADQVLGTSAGATGQWESVPNCGPGSALQYSTSTHAFSCGSAGQIDLPAFQICITAGCGSEVSATRYPIATAAGITLTDCSLNLAIPPTGSSIIVDIQTAAGVSIFGATKLVFTTAGTATTVVHQTTFSGMPLVLDTLLKAVVTQNDSNGVAQFGYVRCH